MDEKMQGVHDRFCVISPIHVIDKRIIELDQSLMIAVNVRHIDAQGLCPRHFRKLCFHLPSPHSWPINRSNSPRGTGLPKK